VPFRPRRAFLVIADAAVDQDGVVRRADDVGLEAQDQHVSFVQRSSLPQPAPVLGE